MPEIKYIMVDMDDTIIDTRRVYDDARRKAYDLVLEKGYVGKRRSNYETYYNVTVSKNNIYRARKDKAEIRTPQSLLDGIEFAFGAIPENIKEQIIKIGTDIFKTPPPAKENAVRALARLRQELEQNHPDTQIVVFTQGDAPWQLEKFSAIAKEHQDIFDHMLVVRDKKGNAYNDFLELTGADASECIMIGDKQKADADPAYKTGMNVYLIPVYDAVENLQERFNDSATNKYFVSMSMEQATKHIAQYFFNITPSEVAQKPSKTPPRHVQTKKVG